MTNSQKRPNFSPFCSNSFVTNPLELATNCLGCKFAANAGAMIQLNGTYHGSCNSDVDVFPLPLYQCQLCNTPVLIAVLVFVILISVITVVVNLWSALVWMSIKKKRPQICFKLSLVLSDFLFGALVLPEAAYHLINTMFIGHEEYYSFYKLTDRHFDPLNYWKDWESFFNPSHIKFSAAMLYITQGASLMSICLVSLDRHIALAYNIHYNRLMTKKRCILLIIVAWIMVILLGILITVFIGSHSCFPFELFLPVAVAYEPEDFLKVGLAFWVPLSTIFFVTVFVTFCTYFSLKKGNRSLLNSFHQRRKTMASSSSFTASESERTCLRLKPVTSTSSLPMLVINESRSDKERNDINAASQEQEYIDGIRLTKRSRSLSKNSLNVVEDRALMLKSNSSKYVMEKNNSSDQVSNIFWRREASTSSQTGKDCENADVSNSKPEASFLNPQTKNSLSYPTTISACSNHKARASFQSNQSKMNSKWSLSSMFRASSCETQANKDYKKANRTMIMILAIYVICALPITIFFALFIFSDDLKEQDDGYKSRFDSITPTGFMVTTAIFMTSSVWNCVIYSIRNRDYRKESKALKAKILSMFESTNLHINSNN